MWDDAAPMLAERFRVIRLDFRGYGGTPMPDGSFVYAADVAALLAALDVDRADVIGVSMGGHVALDLALAHPQLVDRLVLVGAGIDGWQHEADRLAAWEVEEAAWQRGDLDEGGWTHLRDG